MNLCISAGLEDVDNWLVQGRLRRLGRRNQSTNFWGAIDVQFLSVRVECYRHSNSNSFKCLLKNFLLSPSPIVLGHATPPSCRKRMRNSHLLPSQCLTRVRNLWSGTSPETRRNSISSRYVSAVLHAWVYMYEHGAVNIQGCSTLFTIPYGR